MKTVYEEIRQQFRKVRCQAAVESLINNGFDARCFESGQEAAKTLLNEIPAGSQVGAGGSATLEELGLFDSFLERGDTIIKHSFKFGYEKSYDDRLKAFLCEYYLTSSNAITLDGKLVNIDGVGNRVAAMGFGPKTVFVIAGANKITVDIDEALSRTKNIAAPVNAMRIGLNTPCVKKGRCLDCRGPDNICRITTIIERNPMMNKIKVFLIAEEYGF